jgi:hypothetical protein
MDSLQSTRPWPLSPALNRSPEITRESCNPQTLFAGLHRKQKELKKVQMEIEALKLAILLLADEEKEFSRFSVPGRPATDRPITARPALDRPAIGRPITDRPARDASRIPSART